MSRMYRLDGKLVEVTDDELLEAVKADREDYPDDLLTQIVNSCLTSSYIYSKAKFDTAKDTSQMLAAANENQKVLRELLEYQMRIKLDQLVQERLAAQPSEDDEK